MKRKTVDYDNPQSSWLSLDAVSGQMDLYSGDAEVITHEKEKSAGHEHDSYRASNTEEERQ